MYKAIALGLLGALVLSSPASAMAIRVVEDSPDRFMFDVVWGSELPSESEGYAEAEAGDGSHFVMALDLQAFGIVTSDCRFGFETFSVFFDWLEARELAAARVEDFTGCQILALEGEAFGGRFVYGDPYSEPAPLAAVPDGGGAGWMLVAGVALLGGLRSRTGVFRASPVS